MLKYREIVDGIFLEFPNHFIAYKLFYNGVRCGILDPTKQSFVRKIDSNSIGELVG